MFLAGTAVQAGEQLDWLERMTLAVDGRNYVGTFLHLAGNDSRTMRVVHRGGDAGQPAAERLLAVDGPEREVLRRGSVTRCIMPALEVVVIDEAGESPLRAALPDYRGAVADLYRIARLGAERVAGRRTTHVAVQPVDSFRFGYEFWVDEQTALPLKSMTLTENGSVVELMHFTDIAFPERIEESQLEATLPSAGFRTLRPAPAERETLRSAWAAEHLPLGFRLSMATREPAGDGEHMEHLVYTDGLASVSVFIERLHAEPPGRRTNFAEFGAARAYSRTLGQWQIVVIGEVPADTVTMIGRSMRRAEQPARQ